VCNQCRNPLHHNTCNLQATLLPQHSPTTEPLSRCETSAETHCTNSITDPVIERQQTDYKTTRSAIDHTVLLHRTDYKE